MNAAVVSSNFFTSEIMNGFKEVSKSLLAACTFRCGLLILVDGFSKKNKTICIVITFVGHFQELNQ